MACISGCASILSSSGLEERETDIQIDRERVRRWATVVESKIMIFVTSNLELLCIVKAARYRRSEGKPLAIEYFIFF